MSPATYAIALLFITAAIALALTARKFVDADAALQLEHADHDWTRTAYQAATAECERQRHRADREKQRADHLASLCRQHRGERRALTDSLCDAIAEIATMRDQALPDLRDPLSLVVTDPGMDTPIWDAMPIGLSAPAVAALGKPA